MLRSYWGLPHRAAVGGRCRLQRHHSRGTPPDLVFTLTSWLTRELAQVQLHHVVVTWFCPHRGSGQHLEAEVPA
eukprot:1629535-Heterocapsa_arctica.AAC.1